MTAFASTDVTVTIASGNGDIGHGAIGKNLTIATVTFGDAALTYATGGVPMPAIGSFGFQKDITLFLIQQPNANNYHYRYDDTNNKIKIYADTGTLAELANDTAPAAISLQCLIGGE
ncbi:MAG: hypothetical protein ABIL06_13275 [Pseudomonadota bacterium]|uniref:Uncharacterized protein n=1 Tax=viral metagenome TaxID=1070528 RepID=A0A6H1ZG63_9ZZZZ